MNTRLWQIGIAAAVLGAQAAVALAQDEELPPASPNVGYGLALLLGLALIACLMLLLRVRQEVRGVNSQHEQLMRAVVARSNELEATLSSMVEGVLAVDMERRILSVNTAAARLLNVRPERISGEAVADVIPGERLRTLIEQTLETDQPIQTDVDLSVPPPGGGEPVRRLFLAQGAVLRDHNGMRIGSLIVLNDVTRLRRLEVVRRDFVTNASHEIKTPVAAIKAAAETIIDAGDSDPEATRHFLGVIARQSDRLHHIVEDLLALARIEQDQESGRLAREPRPIRAVLEAAVETCGALARRRNTKVEIECDADIVASINATLLEQAVINLLDNAIKYSPPERTVRASAQNGDGEVVIEVVDEGHGIAAEHQARIFERFYRTDKARSRESGGTGLGLAIVKHIALAHGGRVSVQSELGRGSTFAIHIPVGPK